MSQNKKSGWFDRLIWLLLGVASVGILLLLLYKSFWEKSATPFAASLQTVISYQTYIALLMIAILAIYLPIFYVFELPQVLNKLASENRFITKREENTWIPIENSDQFKCGILVCHGQKLDSIFRDAKIVPDTNPTEIPNWLSSKGFEWLGVHSPGITKTGSLTIVVTRVKQSLSQGVPVANCVIEEPKTIRNLRIQFPIFVLVDEIELPDGVLATFLVRAQIEVISPGKFWYGQNGKSFESLIVVIRDKVNRIVEDYDMVDFLLGGAHEKVKDTLQDPHIDLTDALGVKTHRIDIDSWVHNASKEYLAKINAKATVKASLEESEAELQKRERLALDGIKVLQAEEKREEARMAMEKKKAEATKAQGGGDAMVEQAALEIAIVGEEGRRDRLKYQALENTGVTVLGDMGLSGFFGANNPRPKEDKKEKEEKKAGEK